MCQKLLFTVNIVSDDVTMRRFRKLKKTPIKVNEDGQKDSKIKFKNILKNYASTLFQTCLNILKFERHF